MINVMILQGDGAMFRSCFISLFQYGCVPTKLVTLVQ